MSRACFEPSERWTSVDVVWSGDHTHGTAGWSTQPYSQIQPLFLHTNPASICSAQDSIGLFGFFHTLLPPCFCSSYDSGTLVKRRSLVLVDSVGMLG